MSNHLDDHLSLERLLFFSDAVFAIAITLLALELKVPTHEMLTNDKELGDALLEMLPMVMGFFSSFILIGQTWIEHHRIGRFLAKTDRGLLWWNLSLLFFVVIMPFTTTLVSEHFTSRIAVSIYAAGFGCLGFCKVALWRHAQSKGVIKGDRSEIREIGQRVWASPTVSIGVVLLAVIGIPYAYFGFLFIPFVARMLNQFARK